MIKPITFAAVAGAVVTSAEAMSPAPLHEPHDMITQVRGLVAWPRAKCWNVNQGFLMVFAFLMPPLFPRPSTGGLHGGRGLDRALLGRSKGGGQEGAERLP